MKCVLVLAAGALWESAAMTALNTSRQIVVLKRCVDVADLMGAATTGQADVAVVAMAAPGLDLAAIDHLRRHRVAIVGVRSSERDPDRAAHRSGVDDQIRDDEIDRLVAVLLGLNEGVDEDLRFAAVGDGPPGDAVADATTDQGRVIVCWGAQGAPGRTTVAIGLAAELARRRLRTILVDADPWGGSIAQHLGVLDEVSGVLAASRFGVSGDLPERFSSVQRAIDEHLSVITGLPRPDRWPEVRAGSVEHICEIGRRTGQVVVDAGFSIEDDHPLDRGSRPTRNSMTLGALASADEILIVGGADPVGLARLARGLMDLSEIATPVPVRVVINRMRPTLGWSEKEVAGMIEGFTPISSLHFLPEDRTCVDQALVAGVPVSDGALCRALGPLADTVAPESVDPGRRRRLRRRTARTARQR